MRKGAARVVFEIVGTHEEAGVLGNHGGALQTVMAIAIGEDNHGPSVGARNEHLVAVPRHGREVEGREEEGASEWWDNFRHGREMVSDLARV